MHISTQTPEYAGIFFEEFAFYSELIPLLNGLTLLWSINKRYLK